MRMQRRASDSVAFMALLVLMNCGGQTTRSGGDLEVDADSGESGGSENGGFENDETVVSAVSAQAASSTGSGGDGGSSGYGGTDNVGVAGVGAFPGSGGDSSAVVTTGVVIGTGGTTIDWGEVPVPEGCQMTGRHQIYNDECDLEANCDDGLVSAGCFLEGSDYACGCSGSRFAVYGVGAKEACLYALNGCVRSAAFEAGPFYCDITSAEDYPEGCSSRRECSRVASVGDVKLSEFVDTQVACRMGAWGFECACPTTIDNVRFEGLGATSTALCLEAHDWCGGDNLELSGERACNSIPQASFSDLCTTDLSCERDVLASGMEATMFDASVVQCSTRDDGMYSCECPELSLFYVEAPDLDSACSAATDRCVSAQ